MSTTGKERAINRLIGNSDATEFLADVATALTKAGEYRLAKRLFELTCAERALRHEEIAGSEVITQPPCNPQSIRE